MWVGRLALPEDESEIEKWLPRQKKHDTKSYGERPEVVLARYLASVGEDKWLLLGLPQLKRIKAAFRENAVRFQDSWSPDAS